MQVKEIDKDEKVNAWKIDDKNYPEWVQKGFDDKIICWERTPSSGMAFLLVEGCRYGQFQSGYSGYYLIFDDVDYRIAIKEIFFRDYKLLYA